MSPRSPAPLRPAPEKTSGDVALVLGAGGARGLSQIPVLEALDELGLRPAVISGCSIGAIIGAAYAAGLSGAALREHVLASFRDRPRVVAKLLDARVGKLADLVRGLGNPVLIDGERLLDLFWPEAVPDRFEELAIPFSATAADYHRHVEVTLSEGPLTPAVAASLAIPGLVRPVALAGHVLIDGGAINPLPYERLLAPGRTVLAQPGQAGTSMAAPLARRGFISPAPDAAPPEPALPQTSGDYAAAWSGALRAVDRAEFTS